MLYMFEVTGCRGGDNWCTDGEGCRGWENCVACGARVPKLERSGVMVRDIGACCGRSTELIEPVLGLGVDQAKVAGALSDIAGLFGVASQAASKGFVDDPSLLLTLP